jgi:hypothetical protein
VNFTTARQIVRGLGGLVIRPRDGAGEYRVSPIAGRSKAAQEAQEAAAYYTNDLGDAVATARAMAAQLRERQAAQVIGYKVIGYLDLETGRIHSAAQD